MNALVLLCGVLLTAGVEPTKASDDDLKAYQDAKAQAKRDPAAHVRLALWCEAHGLEAERLKHLAIALVTDPQNATARGLMGLVSYRGQWKKPAEVAKNVRDDAALAAALAEYNAKREKAPKTADAQWRLALWCEEKGLKAEAMAHFTAVTRLDPGREAAWKRLGCKKHNGRWMSAEQFAAEKAEIEAQKKADRHWKPLLTKWRDWLGQKEKRAEAERLLAEVTEPAAVPAIGTVFVRGSDTNQLRSVQLLGQIESPRATRVLATLAVFGTTADVRRQATEALKQRDPREFVGWLIALIREPIKYEVRPVGGPGSPGALFVEGKQFNVERLYLPPAMPRIPIFPTDSITYDQFGLPVLLRFAGEGVQRGPEHRLTRAQFDGQAPVDPQLEPLIEQARSDPKSRDMAAISGNSIRLVTSTPVSETLQIPIGQMMVRYQQAAQIADLQLKQDLAVVDAHNRAARAANEGVLDILKRVTGGDLGADRAAWTAWWTDQQGYAYQPPRERQVPTLLEPIVPQVAPTPITTEITRGATTASVVHSCFKAGTLVRTLSGSQPIESIELGDQLLTQNTTTGALSFQPVIAVFHNKPAALYRIDLGSDSISATAIHRFWKAGHGWTMTRDLRPGDRLRTLSGTLTVRSVEEEEVEPVFNLEVASGQSFFVGQEGALVHDNSLVEPVTNPFDAEPVLAAAKAEASTEKN